jgi:hypothetical protein
MGWLRAPAAAAAAAALLATACSFVVSLDGLNDGPPAPGDDASPQADSGDAAVDLDQGSPDTRTADAPDSTVDSSLRDASVPDVLPPRDAPAEVADVGTTTFCASLSPSPLFCEDFDEGSYTQGWSYTDTVTGSLALDGTELRSAPASMIAQSAIAGAGTVDVAAYRAFSLTGTSSLAATLDLDLRVDRADADGGLAVLAQLGLLDGTGGGSYFVQLVADSHGAAPLNASINEAYFATGTKPPPVVHPAAQTVAIGAWTHVTLTVTAPFAGGAGTETLSLDGTQVSSSAISVPVQNFTEVLGVGLTFVQIPSNGWNALYDNVVFDATAQ